MNYYSFNLLPRDARAGLVWRRGRFLAIRQELGCSVTLYYLEGFFVEVWYALEDNRIALVRGFDSRRLLEPYLEGIGLEGLLE